MLDISTEHYSIQTVRPTLIDLFCGCGGLSKGFELAGFRVLAGADKNPQALRTFSRNFPESIPIEAMLDDFDPARFVRKFGLGRGILDCLVGGPPCQGFSKNVPAARRFLDDPRNRLMKVFLEYVERLMPKVLVIENVAEMFNAYEGRVRNEITKTLADLGYDADVAVLNAARFGVPQLRRRTFFIASRRCKHAATFPSATHVPRETVRSLFPTFVTVREALSDLPSLPAGGGMDPCDYEGRPSSDFQQFIRNGNRRVHDHVARRLTPIQLKRIQHLGPGEGMKNLPPSIRPAKGYSGAYARLIYDEPARTITRWVFHPGSGRFIHPQDDRVITIREAARLQSFPDDFVFTGTYIQKSHQVGEAVPPLLAKRIAEEVSRSLSGR